MTKNANIEARRRNILALVAQGKSSEEISKALGTTSRHYQDALGYAWTTPREVARARRAQRTADLVHRGVSLPVAASLQGLAYITAVRDMQLAARLNALRRPVPQSEGGTCHHAAPWGGAWMQKHTRRRRFGRALVAVLDGWAVNPEQ
ncbi:hypothetical protein [Arenimonas sp. MALMAid1274]|uniref:hypothetical protein n=1 Tax=Arenimonas sp. MALMAid1274 TaxID=3411630 RepID=UPI003BA3C7B7